MNKKWDPRPHMARTRVLDARRRQLERESEASKMEALAAFTKAVAPAKSFLRGIGALAKFLRAKTLGLFA